MQEILAEKGVLLSVYRVRKLMRENGLFPITGHKWRPQRTGKGSGRYLDNLINQNFKVSLPNTVWAGDITYIKTSLGWVYLAVVIDLCTKEVVGYSISRRASTELVKRAFANALLASKRDTDQKLVFHSDRGTQYSSKSFQKMCEIYNVTPSMSAASNPFDNAVVESFFSSAKREEIYRRKYLDINEVKHYLFDYIEAVL